MKIISKNKVEELNTKPTSGLNKPKTGMGDTKGKYRFAKPSPPKKASKTRAPIVIKVSDASEPLIGFQTSFKNKSKDKSGEKTKIKSKKSSKSTQKRDDNWEQSNFDHEALILQRREHLEKEKLRREWIRNKKRAQKKARQTVKESPEFRNDTEVLKSAIVKQAQAVSKKPVYTPPPEPSYMAKSYDRFISLIRFNITFKLTLGYGFRIVFLIAFLFVSTYFGFAYFLFYQTQGNLSRSDVYIQSLLQEGYAYDTPVVANYIATEDLYFYYFDSDKKLIYKNTEASVAYDDTLPYEGYDIRQFPDFPTLYQSGKFIDTDQKTAYFVLGKNMNKARGTVEAVLPIGLILGFVLMLSSILSASKMSGKHLKPIKIMTDQVKDMSANNLNTRLNVSGTKDELKDLALTFNQMLDDIQKSYEREKQFVSDASHELRTPIAVIKGYAGMLNRWGKDDPAILEESIQAILGETENMHSLVESLLFIARNDKGTLKMDMSTFNLSDLLSEVVKETHLIDKQHAISDTIQTGHMIYGSIDKLKQALRIFVDNSIKYTPEEGEIKISLRATQSQYVIELSDNGIGISKEDLPHIFDRFYRADKSRTKLKDNQHGGTGLGLSIAKIIVEQHGGAIHVDSELNQGTTFVIMLPKSDLQTDENSTKKTADPSL